ncbi:MAG TPA: nicotinamide-nucleotide adenylyltransferase [Nanoarchaeota archaeon]|nr:nicotinamide-nucleotide adenylyltransferase [Nanoarchaeota archaeon]
MKTGLFIGRFQPFHLGHLSVIRQMEKECDELIIAIGSAQYGFYDKNPMTAGERMEAIGKVLRKEIKKPFCIVPVEDINCYPKYVSHVESLVPEFDVVYNTGNEVIAELFAAAGYEVRNFQKKVGICATEVRKAIAEGSEWKHFVHEEVFSFLVEKKIDERIRRLMKDESR